MQNGSNQTMENDKLSDIWIVVHTSRGNFPGSVKSQFACAIWPMLKFAQIATVRTPFLLLKYLLCNSSSLPILRISLFASPIGTQSNNDLIHPISIQIFLKYWMENECAKESEKNTPN